MARAFVLHAYTLDNMQVEAKRHRFAGLPIRVGRNPLNDFHVPHPLVSSFHARIENVDGAICVRDLNSKNGVYVPGYPGQSGLKRITPDTPTDLSASSFQFFLGPEMRVQVSFDEAPASVALRAAPGSGSVLGNPAMLLEQGDAGALPPLPAPPGGGGGLPLPPLGAENPYAGAAPGALPPLPENPFGPAQGAPPAPGGYPAGAPLPLPGHGGVDPRGGGLPYEAPRPSSSTQHFQHLGLESLALQGLRELASSLVPGNALETTGDVARLITKLHDAMDVFCRSFIPMRDGYSQFVSSLDLQQAAVRRSMYRSRAYEAVAEARTPEAVAAALLDFRDPSFDAPQAVEGIFADMMLHQMALLDGVMRGVRALLDELSPDNLERQVPGTALGILGRRYRELWETYRQRFEDLSDERQAFAYIFGPEFTAAYRQYRKRRSETS